METIDLNETTSANNGFFAPAATVTNSVTTDTINFIAFVNVGSNTMSIAGVPGFTISETQPGTWGLVGTGDSAAWQAALRAVQIAGTDPTPVHVVINYTETGSPTPTTSTPVTDTVNCFMAGTLIRTPGGDVPVESLKADHLVLTNDGRAVPVIWVGIQTIAKRFVDPVSVLPVRIKAGALGENTPSRDLKMSPDHAILIEGTLVHAGALINGSSIVREADVPEIFSYYHVETEDHSLILAENVAAETFIDNVDRRNFDNWAEHEARYPEGKEIAELGYPRAKSHRQVPARVRAVLEARAVAIVDLSAVA